MKFIRLLSIIVLPLFNSCNPAFYSSKVSSAEINDVGKLEVYSYIDLVSRGNKSEYNDSLSSVVNEKLETVFRSSQIKSGRSFVEILSSDSLDIEFKREIRTLVLSANFNKRRDTIKITPKIDSLLVANNKRFGLILCCRGFTRVKGNYAEEIAKGVGMGLVSLGMYYQIPIKAIAALDVIIVDSQEKNIAFCNSVSLGDSEPTNDQVLSRLIDQAFKKYFK